MSEQPAEQGATEISFEVGERDIAFDLDEELYPLDAIYGAAYLFINRCYVFLTRPSERIVHVRLRHREDTDEAALEKLAGSFANELLNQVLRLRIARSTAPLREQILARAFSSSGGTDTTIAQLLAELDAEELDDEPLEIAVPWEKRAENEAKDGAPKDEVKADAKDEDEAPKDEAKDEKPKKEASDG